MLFRIKMNKQVFKQHKLALRKRRVRSRVTGSLVRPRLSVSRSISQIYAQLIDDVSGKTLASANSLALKGNKVEQAAQVGSEIAKLALDQKIETIVFDRGGYRYHGRVKALADAMREAGLKF
ncbi:MAG: 50S ribosomal protein L18 [Candidatus Doudnabacteria bacterium]